MHRRDWLKRTAAGLALGTAPLFSRAYAAPGAQDARFLLVFLRGAYDATNVLIPAGSDFYYESRKKIAIRKPVATGEPADPRAALSLAAAAPKGAGAAAARAIGDWALHPALGGSMLPLWQRGELAFVPFAGSSDLSRSHFETQDSLEAGLALPGDAVAPTDRARSAALRGSGFLNRLAAALGARGEPVAFTDGLPLALSGGLTVPNVSLKGTGRTPFDERQTRLLAQMYQGTRFEAAIAEGFELRQTVAQEAEAMQRRNAALAASAPEGEMAMAMAGRMQEMQAASRRALSAKGFELEARRMAALMRERYNIGFIDVGGWDTHVNQGGAQGQLANLLDNLGRGLAGFAEESGESWDKTVVVVVSEFGRTFRENGTGGTDHGHGTAYWVAGGAVCGGRIAGEQVGVTPQTLNQGRDWPVLNDNRALLGGLFKRLYGLSDTALAEVLPGATARDFALL
ncbi:MAG TPA: DUF1501 domain-containing protein [Ideonella sp.]|nr:DUF1501 domain-containing protein [Ideonella sp.]